METQTPHNGLSQLFMSLGLSASPLKGIEGSGSEDSAAFDSLLAGYLPTTANITTDTSVIPTQTSLDVTDTLTDSLLGQDLIDGSLNAREELPLSQTDLGNTLPLLSSVAAATIDTLSADHVSMLNEPEDMSSVLGDSDEQALLKNQGFYAQSLVSSLMPIEPLKAPAVNALSASMKSASEGGGRSVMGTVNSSLSKNNGLELSTAVSDADTLDVDSEVDVDQFLGAMINQSVSKDYKPHKGVEAGSPQSLSVQGSTIAQTEQANITQIALAMNEDPTDVSLQELADMEDIETTNVEQKLATLERKQDDQTLRLTKGQQAWGDALAGRITMNAAQDIKQVTIHLDPPELGSLELKLNVKDDQQTHVHVNVQNPQVKEALESSAHRLRDMLMDQGLELSGFDVQTGSQQERQNNEQSSGTATGDNTQDSDALSGDDDNTINIPAPKNNNLLDTFV